MAFGQSNGTIILSTKVNTDGIKQGVSGIESMVKKLGNTLAIVFSVKAITDFSSAVINAYSDFEQLVGGVEKIFDQANINQIIEDSKNAFYDLGMNMNKYMSTINDVGATFAATMGDQAGYETARKGLVAISDYASGTGKSMETLSEKFTLITRSASSYQSIADQFSGILPATSKDFLEQAQAAGYLSSQYDTLTSVPIAEYQQAITSMLSKGVSDLGLAGNTAAEAASTISGSAVMVEAAWENMLIAISSGEGIDRAINNLVYSLSTYFANIVPVVERALIGIGQVIEGIAPMLVQTVAQAFIKAIPSLVAAIYMMIIGAAKGIYAGIVDLIKGKTIETLETQSESIGSAVENQSALTDEVKETEKALKKTLAGFDDLQILSSGAADNADTESAISSVSAVGGGTSVSSEASAYESAISTDLAAIMALAGTALAAIGLILLFTGNIPLGIGFLIAGAVSLGVSIPSLGDANEVTKSMEKIFGKFGGLIAGLGAALIVIGLILACTGVGVPLGVGLISIGAMALTGAVMVNWDSIVTTVKNIFTEFGSLIAELGAALIVLGIILCCTGVGIGLGIGLIVAGAAFVVGSIVANWDSIVSTVKNIFANFGGLIAGLGAALIVLGIILCCTGVGIGLGIGMIVAGAAAIGGVIAVNWNSIVEWVKSAWESVKTFWRTHISKYFTATWWLSLGKTCINGLIAGFEGGINAIIGAFESMINWFVNGLNKISFDIPDWIPGIGGKEFGFNLDTVKFNRVSIPRLAAGAVIPANKEFLAVLGDQKHGVNIETPLETMLEAFNTALDSRGDTVREEHYYLSETELMSILYKLVKGGERLNGHSLVNGGGF